MSDRLKDLQRQRALAQEQLAWIDAEIAKETAQAAPSHPRPAILPTPLAETATSAAETERLADELLAKYQGETATSPAAVKRGCYLYFAFAFLLVGLAVVALYFYSASRH